MRVLEGFRAAVRFVKRSGSATGYVTATDRADRICTTHRHESRAKRWSVRGDDQGQALIFALMFIALFGAWSVSLLGLATGDLVGTRSVASQITSTYSEDATLVGAMGYIQYTLAGTSTWFSSNCTSTTSYQTIFTYNSVSVGCELVAGASSFDYVTLKATSGSSTVTAGVTFYNNSPSLSDVQITSWSD